MIIENLVTLSFSSENICHRNLLHATDILHHLSLIIIPSISLSALLTSSLRVAKLLNQLQTVSDCFKIGLQCLQALGDGCVTFCASFGFHLF